MVLFVPLKVIALKRRFADFSGFAYVTSKLEQVLNGGLI